MIVFSNKDKKKTS